MFEFFSIYYESEVEDFKEKLKVFKDVKPQDLSIKAQFCLNEITLKFQNELKEKKNKQ